MLGLVVLSAVVQSLRALVDIGLAGLFGPELISAFLGTGKETYGLLGPISGTLLVGAISLSLALPASLALAIFATELPRATISRILDGILSTLAGIPPIAYALMGVFFMEVVMRPKFGGWDLPSEEAKSAALGWTTWNQGLFPVGMPNSTLLGGMLIGLLIQPFMTPLIVDALRSVPGELREGSYALGAGRWYTLTRVVLPGALPGIISAATLGTLKAIGDVTIAYFVIGTATFALRVPSPPIDIFAKTPPLASAAAGLMGGIGGDTAGAKPDAISVANFAGLMLILLAFAIMSLATRLERSLRRR
jgi:ABC-type phosphate transport system permease subunit